MADETIRIKFFKITYFLEAPLLEYFCNETFLLIFQHGDVGSEVDALVHEHKSRYPSRKGKKIIGFAECWCPTLFSPSIIKMVSDANNNLILAIGFFSLLSSSSISSCQLREISTINHGLVVVCRNHCCEMRDADTTFIDRGAKFLQLVPNSLLHNCWRSE